MNLGISLKIVRFFLFSSYYFNNKYWSYFKNNIPDIAFLFAWNHKEEIFLKEKEFKKNGGTWFSHVTL